MVAEPPGLGSLVVGDDARRGPKVGGVRRGRVLRDPGGRRWQETGLSLTCEMATTFGPVNEPAVGDQLAGGYFVLRSRAGSPPWMPDHLGVARAISASSELVPAFPTPTWANDFDVLAAEFGLDPDERAAAGELADDLMTAGMFGWPNVFFELHDAHDFHRSFASGRADIVVIGIGLDKAHANPFLQQPDLVPLPVAVDPQNDHGGVSQRLERREPLTAGGRALGYELLGMDVPPLTSWAVNDLPVLVHDRLGISVNEDGLITSFDEASRAAKFISRPDVPSEPLSWTPWLIVQYS